MSIDFHNKKNQATYTTRTADKSWIEKIKNLVPIENISNALDVGCGGGIYSKALSDIGVGSVTGVDFSEAILKSARDSCREYKNVIFKHGNALETGLDSNSYNLLLERALIHHIEDLKACFKEGYRVLKNEGFYIIQDRTPEDCLLEGNDSHIRGYFAELFPKLIEMETKRRYNSKNVIDSLQEVGFKSIEEFKLWETRKVYSDKNQLLKDLSERTGRSILHGLNDEELKLLISHIDKSLSTNTNIIEKDRWTIWKAVK
ncbi:methyltransferase domain-containing protein [Virgibacillus sp. C22-A2]|uniref:Methyltransferase domain-containing protein n=1 Tax=Virgibacillus tibetensis TaxID=3042313 RepID=A0ABU6KEF3_9BACI|nr:methyltransferase domain-containing protein [Virgibacillus sp. C22-A2]